MKILATSLMVFFLFLASALAGSVVEGTVQKIDHQSGEIALNTESGTVTVMLNGRTKGAASVKSGDKVKVTYIKEGEKFVAESILPNEGGSPLSPSEMPGA